MRRGCLAASVQVFTLIGCQQAQPIVNVWFFEGTHGLGAHAAREMPPAGIEWRTRRVELAGALGETLSCRFAVRSADPVGDPDFRIARFRSVDAVIDSSAITLYRLHRVPIESWPGWHLRYVPPRARDREPLDVLVPVRAPRGGLPAQMEGNETYVFWADVTIPLGTAPGTYTTSIELTSAGAALGEVAIQLTVWPFVLPVETDVPLIAEVDHRKLFSHHVQYHGRPHGLAVDDWRDDPLRSDLDALLMSTLRMLRQHRLTPVLGELAPIVKVTAGDGVAIDWGQYDAIVEPCLNGKAFFSRVPLQVWPMPLQCVLEFSEAGSAGTDPAGNALLREYSARCASHFAQKNWLKRSYAVVPAASRAGENGVEATRRFASIVSGGSEHVRVLSRLFPQDPAPYGWVDFPYREFSDSVDIWMPPGQFFDEVRMAAERASGRSTWMAIDRPPFSGSVSIQASPADVRVLSWQAEEMGAEAMFIGKINEWPDALASPTPEDCVRADPRVLLYPGGPFGLDEPVQSVRLKHLRRSMQDAAYLRLLGDYGLGHLANTLRRSLAPYAGSGAYRTHFADGRSIGWPEDAELFEDARHIMATEIVRISSDSPDASSSADFTRSAEWRRLLMRTRKLHVHVDGTRIRLSGTRARPRLEVECALTLVNATRVPVAGKIRFVDLPEGWEATPWQAISTIQPGRSRRVKLVTVAPGIPVRQTGALRVPIELSTDDGLVRRLDARVSCASAVRLAGSIRVDGDLSDWPFGTVNVMSDFTLISGTGANASSQDSARPQRQTIAFALRDDDNLFIAVNCESDPQLRPANSRRKRVRYEDMIPMAGELIEVLIDPGNAGTRSPEDLYHIVVMHSGADLAEQGIRFDPPCGRRKPWPADIDVATRVTAGRWMVELRIPLAAFPSGARDHVVWGFNVTRFDGSGQEFSTWSGAVHNAYDPLSLGNLFLP